MNRKIFKDGLFVLIGFSVTAMAMAAYAASPASFKAGSWEVTRAGGPRSQAPVIDRYCFTEAQLRADPAAPIRTMPKDDGKGNAPKCTLSNANLSNGTVTMTGSCKGPMGTIKPKWTGTYDATSFAMTGKAKMAFMSVKLSAAGKYLGPCSAK
jgi:hypothetical protein